MSTVWHTKTHTHTHTGWRNTCQLCRTWSGTAKLAALAGRIRSTNKPKRSFLVRLGWTSNRRSELACSMQHPIPLRLLAVAEICLSKTKPRSLNVSCKQKIAVQESLSRDTKRQRQQNMEHTDNEPADPRCHTIKVRYCVACAEWLPEISTSSAESESGLCTAVMEMLPCASEKGICR